MKATPKEHESQVLTMLGRIIQRRKAILALCLMAALVPILIYNQTTPPLYEASTSLVFEELGSPVLHDVYTTSSPEMYLFNRIEEIKSRSFAYDIAKALPNDIKARIPNPPAGNPDPMQYLTDVIQRSITVSPLRNSNLVRIRVQMSDPNVCLTVANLSLEVLQERNYRVRHQGVADLRKFIENQLVRFSSQLRESEQKLRVFKEANAITSLDNESNEILKRMTEAEVLLNTTRADQEAAQQRLAVVETTLSTRRDQLATAVISTASPSAQRLKDELIALQTQDAQLVLDGYPTVHAQRTRLLQQIEQTKRALSDEAMQLARGSHVGDPIAQIEQYVQQSVSLETEIESMKARENALDHTLAGYRHYLSKLPSQEVELARLQLDRDVNARIYASLLERREEVRISEAKQIPNSRVIDYGRFPRQPIRPRKAQNLLLGMLVGVILGSSVGLVLESRAGRLGSMQEFEREIGWSVLALVPRVERGGLFQRLLQGGWPKRRGSESDRSMALVSHRNPESPAGEAYFMLRTRLELLGIGTKHRSLLITSSWPQEGKSTTLSNLAAAFGAAGGAAVVVDAELRRPVLHTIFDAQKVPGLSDLLLTHNGDGRELRPQAGLLSADAIQRRIEGSPVTPEAKKTRANGKPRRSKAASAPADASVAGATVADATVGDDTAGTATANAAATGAATSRVGRLGAGAVTTGAKRVADFTPSTNGMFQTTAVEGITLLASGKRVRETQWQSARPKLRGLVEDLESRYDVVLLDSASPILVSDTLTLCGMVDAVLVVVDAQSYDEERLIETKRLLESAGANVVGAVVNKVDPGGRYSYYYHHYY
jgi:uncharacterized protein involved in exopolysaccharide biosynthesis/Mrp family chromosome partitioning ATPase